MERPAVEYEIWEHLQDGTSQYYTSVKTAEDAISRARDHHMVTGLHIEVRLAVEIARFKE